MSSQKHKNTAERETVTRGTANLFADLGFPKSEAADLKVKAKLVLRLYLRIKELGLTQVTAAERLGVSQPDVSKLMNGRHSGYSIDRLLAFLNALEVDIDIIVRPKHHGRAIRRGIVRVKEVAAA